MIRPGDVVIAAAAVVPCKTTSMLVDNARIARTVEQALLNSEASHVINISSDAVYADDPVPITEDIAPSPQTIHGVMHLMREVAISGAGLPTLHMRPTLIYGPGDPHDGYGPNRFRRQARRGEAIVLFGHGEEQRDHIHIDDVARMVIEAACRKVLGVLNLACGEVWSFARVAEAICSSEPACPGVSFTERSGPMPHGGFRPFDTALLSTTFPDIRVRTPGEGLSSEWSVESTNGV